MLNVSQMCQNSGLLIYGFGSYCLENKSDAPDHHLHQLYSVLLDLERMRNRLLLKWPQCTLFNDFGTLCCNKIKKIYKIQIYKISSFLFFLKFYKEKKNQITQEIYSLWSTTFHFMSSQIATCLTDQNNYSTAVDQILHALCFELGHSGPLPRAAAPAEKDTRTIGMLKECLAMRGWNMYISLYIFTGRNLITPLTLFFLFSK